jgi:hypothetical protein
VAKLRSVIAALPKGPAAPTRECNAFTSLPQRFCCRIAAAPRPQILTLTATPQRSYSVPRAKWFGPGQFYCKKFQQSTKSELRDLAGIEPLPFQLEQLTAQTDLKHSTVMLPMFLLSKRGVKILTPFQSSALCLKGVSPKPISSLARFVQKGRQNAIQKGCRICHPFQFCRALFKRGGKIATPFCDPKGVSKLTPLFSLARSFV